MNFYIGALWRPIKCARLGRADPAVEQILAWNRNNKYESDNGFVLWKKSKRHYLFGSLENVDRKYLW